MSSPHAQGTFLGIIIYVYMYVMCIYIYRYDLIEPLGISMVVITF